MAAAGVGRDAGAPVLGNKPPFCGSKSERGIEVAGLFHTMLHSVKSAGVEPREYLRQAVRAVLQDQHVPLPHEIVR